MTQKAGLILLTTGALAIASVLAFPSHGIAQDHSTAGVIKLAEAGAQKKAAPRAAPKAVAPRTVAPRTVAPRTGAPRTVAPKTVTPRIAPTGPKTVAPKRVTPKAVTPKQAPKRVVTPKAVPPKAVAPKAIPPKGVAPKVVSPRGLSAIGTRRTGRVIIGGRNYSIWRGSHRVRYDGRWATLAALSALSVFFYAGAPYYPYAYISATGPYCEGITEDGCILRWEEVPTLDGPRVFQCVAYCPWQ
jgi:hypothetical protein